MKIIKFFSVNDEYGEFSNFAKYSILIDGEKWSTSEHYFQAMKFNSIKYRKMVKHSSTPMEAAIKGRNRKEKIKRNWNKIKDNIMYNAVYAKFTQHESLRELLLSTKDSKLIENSPIDEYWGNGANNKGLNRLGTILMNVRKKLVLSCPHEETNFSLKK